MDEPLNASFEEEPASQGDESTEEAPYSSQFFNGEQFLSTVPEQDRPLIQKYLAPVMQNWDGGLKKKFTESAEERRRWQELGEFEEVQKAHAFVQRFRQNGEQMFGDMVKGFFEHYGPEAYVKLNELLGVTPVSNLEWGQEQEELDPRDIQMQNMQQEMEEFRAWREQQETERQESVLNKAIDDTIAFMQTNHSHIPQDYALQAMAAGITKVEDIVKSFDNFAKSIGSQQQARPNPPRVMGAGQGGLPTNQVDVSKLDRNGREAAVAQWLEAAGQ